MNRKTSMYTVTFAPGGVLEEVITSLPHTLSGSGVGPLGKTAFIRIRCKDDAQAVRLADTCTRPLAKEGRIEEYEITTGVGIHRRSVDVDNIRRTLASQD